MSGRTKIKSGRVRMEYLKQLISVCNDAFVLVAPLQLEVERLQAQVSVLDHELPQFQEGTGQ